ncbi:MAG: Peptidase family [Firmicutes bacterium]|nr:Peptidase family [Bacillota bacterium]
MFGFSPDAIFQIPALLIALTVHEYGHARVAVSLGDPTPRAAGRLTLNPIPHLDAIGLLMLWLAHFGWAKPVPVNPYNLRNGKRGMMLVSFAGPGFNFITAFICAVGYSFLSNMHILTIEVAKVIQWTYIFNLALAVFNLIPLPPLDGSKIVSEFLPVRQANAYEKIATYGPIILIVLVYIGVVGAIINPIIGWLDYLIKFVISLIL